MKTLTIHIDKDGKTDIVTSGFEGSDCKKATEDLEKRLGRSISDENTPEFYQISQTETVKQ